MWMTEWRAISGRIAGLLDAGKFLLSTKVSDEITSAEVSHEKNSGDTAPARYILGAVKILGRNAKVTGDVLQDFFDSQASQLPGGPRACLRTFVEETRFGFGHPDRLAGV